ncbi:SPW repeat protein [Hyphomicrobium denitrificans 1NES1]|uniref:SPW repeat protein n=1 Tax=Hyphomicrobium denitrificans 1NES1 TaxID=670307 RepID=N0B7Q4_9HYPH|nr:SPW repeat protein [Hyphomicrobium denitrificans]AGK56551.1 SPW repeat protein [Hyphomicrobium denitrificans 1NES1]
MAKSQSYNGPALDIINVIAGLGLLLSPWYLGYTGESYATWNAWVVGAVVALIALGALVAFSEYEEWVNLILGLWSIVAPWALGFSTVTGAMWAHVTGGVVIAVLAASNVWFNHNRPLSAA